MPRRVFTLDDDTFEQLQQLARIRQSSVDRTVAQCVREVYLACSVGELMADHDRETEKQRSHLWIVATDAAGLGARV